MYYYNLFIIYVLFLENKQKKEEADGPVPAGTKKIGAPGADGASEAEEAVEAEAEAAEAEAAEVEAAEVEAETTEGTQ